MPANTNLELDRHAADFAFSTLAETSERKLTEAALTAFKEAGMDDQDWDNWNARFRAYRARYQQFSQQPTVSKKAQIAAAAAAQKAAAK